MIRTGVDIIEIHRVQAVLERYSQRFLNRVFTDSEIQYCRGRAPNLAARFAAKEATMKALGTGVRAVGWKDIEITRHSSGAPGIQLYNRARARAISLNIKEIIVKSSNIGTAKIAKKIGKEKQIDFFKKIGFFDRIESNFKEAALPLGNQNNWGELETMTIGYGHGFAITPMHLALAYMAVLNDGKKIKAKFLLNESDHKTNTIISKSTSNYIKELLRAVVNETEYTGPRVKIDGYDVGGKTGTAELIKANGVYDKNANRTLFVGSFPMFNPKFLIVTVINNPKKIKSENNNITGASVNAPLVKNIILRIIEIFNIPQLSSQQILNAAITNNYSKSYVVN